MGRCDAARFHVRAGREEAAALARLLKELAAANIHFELRSERRRVLA